MNISSNIKIDHEKLWKFILNDKKFDGKSLSLIKIEEIGKPFIIKIDVKELHQLLLGE